MIFGAHLLAGLFTRVSAFVVGDMMALFIRGPETDYGCFGAASGATAEAAADGETASLWVRFLRDIWLLALGLQLVYAAAGRFSVNALLGRTPNA